MGRRISGQSPKLPTERNQTSDSSNVSNVVAICDTITKLLFAHWT